MLEKVAMLRIMYKYLLFIMSSDSSVKNCYSVLIFVDTHGST